MDQRKIIEIPLSRGKLVKGLVGSSAFVIIGLWIVLIKSNSEFWLFNNPVFKYGFGILAILVFGGSAVLYLLKLRDKKPGLVIDENGIIDNSGGLAAGFIPWSDINQFHTVKMMKQEFLVINVKNPDFYVNRQKSLFRKKGMQYNLKHYGSPVAISTNTLKCRLPELLTLLEEKSRIA